MLQSLSDVLRARARVLVIGGYGCGNVGDEAILSVMLHDLKAIGATAVVMSVAPASTARMHDVEAVPASPRALLFAIVSCDAVLIGGGGIFSAYMGARSRHLPDVARVARMFGRRVIFRAIGAYASTPPRTAHALVRAIERSDFVSVRDAASIDALRHFGLRREVVLEDDPALRLEVKAHPGMGDEARIGIAVRRLRNPAEHCRLRDELVRFVDALIDDGRHPVLLPFCRHPSATVEQDDSYAEELRARCQRPRAVVIEHVEDPREMLQRVSSLAGIVAMRFHAMVFASMTAVATVAIPYDDKCRSFLSRQAPDMPAIEPAHVTATALLHAISPASQVAA